MERGGRGSVASEDVLESAVRILTTPSFHQSCRLTLIGPSSR